MGPRRKVRAKAAAAIAAKVRERRGIPPKDDEVVIEAVIMAHLAVRGPGWATSREVAAEIGFPWRMVARAMLRMPEIEKQEMTWISSRSRTRICTIYRYVSPPVVAYPAWMTGAVVHE